MELEQKDFWTVLMAPRDTETMQENIQDYYYYNYYYYYYYFISSIAARVQSDMTKIINTRQ
jgi:hypothetical protein